METAATVPRYALGRKRTACRRKEIFRGLSVDRPKPGPLSSRTGISAGRHTKHREAKAITAASTWRAGRTTVRGGVKLARKIIPSTDPSTGAEARVGATERFCRPRLGAHFAGD